MEAQTEKKHQTTRERGGTALGEGAKCPLESLAPPTDGLA
jgi:hypothetical protein